MPNPPLEYWFIGPAYFLPATFVFAVVICGIGIKHYASRILLGVLFLLTCIGWYSVAQQGQDAKSYANALGAIADYMKLDSGYSTRELAEEIPKRLKPEIRQIGSTTLTANADGTYTSTLIIEVDSLFTPPALSVMARAPTITGMQIASQSPSEMKVEARGDGFYTQRIDHPSGLYLVNIGTKNSEPIKLDYDFNQ